MRYEVEKNKYHADKLVTNQVMLVMMMALRVPSMCSLVVRWKAWALAPMASGTMRMEMVSEIMHESFPNPGFARRAKRD